MNVLRIFAIFLIFLLTFPNIVFAYVQIFPAINRTSPLINMTEIPAIQKQNQQQQQSQQQQTHQSSRKIIYIIIGIVVFLAIIAILILRKNFLI
jgi:cytochrome b561